MIKHKCNNVIVPVLPEEPDFPYSIMLQPFVWDYDLNEPCYVVVYSKMPFFVIGTKIVYFVAGNEWKCYQAISTGERWTEIQLIPADQNSEIEAIGDTYMYVWCGENIEEYPDYNICYGKSTPEEINAADPPYGMALFGSAYTYSVGSEVTGLSVWAESPDGGQLSFAWHRKVNGRDAGVVSTDSVFYPPTDTIGTNEYYCIIDNHLNGTATGLYTHTVAITVVEAVRKSNGVLIGYVLRLVGVPCGEQLGLMIDRYRTLPTAVAYSIRKSLMPCRSDKQLISSHTVNHTLNSNKGVD